KVPPEATIIMLAAIYYGAQYGGSTTSILMNIPGEVASIVTCLDGYQMARKGRAGPALGISAFGSFIAGTFGVMGIMLLALPMVKFALSFGPPEYFTLMILGLILLSFLSRKSFLKAFMVAALGLVLSYVGMDPIAAQPRFVFNIDHLYVGIPIVPMVVGLFGIAEIMENLEKTVVGSIFKTHLKGLLPTLQDWKDSIGAIVRGSFIGFFLGVLPGGGALLGSFTSYTVEKRLSKHPEKFGTGVIEGVAGPESANNAGSSGGLIPLLTLGIPSNVVSSILFTGLLIHNITPGPLMLQNRPDMFWGLITSMYLGNVMLLVLNLPLIGIWVKMLKVPFNRLFVFIIIFCLIGVYSLGNSVWDLGVMITFGILGYLMRKGGFESPPFILAFILGPRVESALRQSLLMSQGDLSIFITRPIALTCLVIAVIIISLSFFKFINQKKAVMLVGDE
ncbi:MAG: tripartite tricarboxylate transporter permease, partial [Deltaproteobacteria bacterium]|nr:tripartite tricarboxylate transporter permease [Deltaproteobacteria bacterium]